MVGLWRPRVLLPSAASEWSAERRRAVLVHELGHVRRRDGLALCLGQLSCALYWFQPLVWIALRRLRRQIQLVMQDPYTSLNPRRTVAEIVGLGLALHFGLKRGAIRERVAAMRNRTHGDFAPRTMRRYRRLLNG